MHRELWTDKTHYVRILQIFQNYPNVIPNIFSYEIA